MYKNSVKFTFTEFLFFNDYYPFGMPMPNRNSINNQYRYAYQGQEKDPETGKEAFELRLWDARIGRWLTTDPAGQYASPYLGMGNNPMLLIDPDGGFAFGPDPKNLFSDRFLKHGFGVFFQTSEEIRKSRIYDESLRHNSGFFAGDKRPGFFGPGAALLGKTWLTLASGFFALEAFVVEGAGASVIADKAIGVTDFALNLDDLSSGFYSNNETIISTVTDLSPETVDMSKALFNIGNMFKSGFYGTLIKNPEYQSPTTISGVLLDGYNAFMSAVSGAQKEKCECSN